MLFKRKRHTVPASRYGTALDVLEAMGWTWQEWLAQPADLCEELLIKFSKRASAQSR